MLTVYGGRAYEPQIEALQRGVEIVVGTPGRLIDLAKQGHLDLGHARIVVLDEADEMLDLGFLPDVEKLLALTPAARQTMLFSATMPGAVVALARRYMSQPTHIRAMGDDQENAHTVKAVEQFVYRAHAMDKVEMLARMLQARDRGLTIIFSRTKRTAAKVADDLAERGFAAAAIHGDLGQGAREQALRAFRNGKVDVLVATDVAARGIDVENVTHVINYQCPEDEKTYLHRIGRTARAGNTGVAVTFVDWDDLHRWGMINKVLDLGMPEPQETYSSSPHLYSDLDIPEGSKGRLPRAAADPRGPRRRGARGPRRDRQGRRTSRPGGRPRRPGGRAGGQSGGRSSGGRSDGRGESRGGGVPAAAARTAPRAPTASPPTAAGPSAPQPEPAPDPRRFRVGRGLELTSAPAWSTATGADRAPGGARHRHPAAGPERERAPGRGGDRRGQSAGVIVLVSMTRR